MYMDDMYIQENSNLLNEIKNSAANRKARKYVDKTGSITTNV